MHEQFHKRQEQINQSVLYTAGIIGITFGLGFTTEAYAQDPTDLLPSQNPVLQTDVNYPEEQDNRDLSSAENLAACKVPSLASINSNGAECSAILFDGDKNGKSRSVLVPRHCLEYLSSPNQIKGHLGNNKNSGPEFSVTKWNINPSFDLAVLKISPGVLAGCYTGTNIEEPYDDSREVELIGFGRTGPEPFSQTDVAKIAKAPSIPINDCYRSTGICFGYPGEPRSKDVVSSYPGDSGGHIRQKNLKTNEDYLVGMMTRTGVTTSINFGVNFTQPEVQSYIETTAAQYEEESPVYANYLVEVENHPLSLSLYLPELFGY